jgi:spore germination cell wall hydrolase CwlJ-like protein
VADNQKHADITFLALTLWREARGESDECIAGVAGVILNRVARPAWWGVDVMTVCFKKFQFSSLTDPRDRQLTLWPRSDDKSWQKCLKIAVCAISGGLQHPAPGSDSYHDISIPAPEWADPKKFVRQIGRIRFYNLDEDVEEPK